MLSVSASSNAAWVRWGNAATASGSGWGGGSMRSCVERTSGPVCHVSSASSLFRRLTPSSFKRYRRRFAPVCRCTSHRIPRERSHEQASGTDGQGFTGALERQTVREGLREHPRDLRIGIASGDCLAQEADRRSFVRARVEPEWALQELVLLEQRLAIFL